MTKWVLSQRCIPGYFNIHKSINVIYHINKRKDKVYIIISIDAEKASDKIPHPFMIKHLSKLEVERDFLIPIEGIFGKLTINMIVNAQRLNTIP